ncbi:MAG: ATP-binding protein [Candidatus Babeliales bacterium]
MSTILGHIISGSLSDGFLMRIAPDINLEQIKTGKFVCITGVDYTFFSLITDLALHVTNPDIVLFPPSPHETLLNKTIRKKEMYATAQLKALLMAYKLQAVMPVKTIPNHFAAVREATSSDVSLIFGDPAHSSKKYFTVGTPLDMQTPVCIDLEKLTERSNGIFGKTGTGKTFITRLVLAGLIKQKKAVNLIFDMHSEYGLQARKEGDGLSFVKGLKTLFGSAIALFSLDPDATRRRGASADVTITIPLTSIQVEDVMCLQEELNLHPTALEAAYLIHAQYKQNWLEKLLSSGESIKEFAQEIGAHPESVAALYRKLKRIERLPFFIPSAQAQYTSCIDQMMEYINSGVSIIIEFGNFTSTFCYLLIANIITRRIHYEYIKRTEHYLATQKKSDEPQKLMITVEEAHKFLNPQAARQTIFGVIAREMRKYYVSLLIVDQRPSGIDPEIISQIGTKIVAQLNDEKDIAAVLTGANNSNTLRTVLSGLDTKKQALVIGHAVAMPVVVQTREYDETFYKDMQSDVSLSPVATKEIIESIF